MSGFEQTGQAAGIAFEDDPRERAAVHAKARCYGATEGSHAQRRVEALRAARPRVLSPAASPAVPGAANWVPIGPSAIPNGQTYGGARTLVSGRVTGIAVDPTDRSTIYVAAARGGVWKTQDGGASWTPKSDNEVSLAIGALALAPSAPGVLYAGTGEGNIYYYRTVAPLESINESYQGSGVLKSMDGGDTWTAQGTAQFTGACFYAIAVHPTDPNTAYAATSAGLYRTTDGGGTWRQLRSGLPAISPTVIAATDVVIDPAAPGNVYVAFWGSGAYRTTNGGAANPSFSAIAGLPSALSRITLALAPSSPSLLYAAVAGADDGFAGLYCAATASTDGSFAAAPLGGASISAYGAYTAALAVDVSTPDVVYISGVSLYKAVYDPVAGAWTVTDVGGAFHPDNHALALDPTDHQTVYAGSDGGIYRSADGGGTWDDRINSGLSLAQFEFAGQHPTSDAVVFAGTQDNGTEQFRNSPVFHHAADGDGGAVVVDQADPRNVLHTYFSAQVERSTAGGAFGTFTQNASGGLAGECLFYPPMAADPTNASNVAFGTDRLCLDGAQGTGGWPTQVALPGISGCVSAIAYVDSGLIYAATSSGQVYRAVRAGTTWTATQISAAPLPPLWIWDIETLPGDVDTVVVVMAGFGAPHVHRGVVAAGGGSATWTDISGTAPDRLPDIPVNSLELDPADGATMYVGTDVGVFRTSDGGAHWSSFNDGLPNTAVYDLQLHAPTRLLRAATHGRGMWERPLDGGATPNVELFLRDHLMDTGRRPPPAGVAAAFADPLQSVALGDELWWWMCPDVKIDSPEGTPPAYQMPVAAVDYVAFESRLAHRSVKRARLNRVYVQLHNRGIVPATDAVVKVLYAAATAGVPDLPSDFWTRFPNDSLDPASQWTPVGAAQTAPPVLPTQPVVLEWDWTPPAATAEHSCMLVVVDSASDPIPTAHRILDVGGLVTLERRVAQRNLHVVDAPPGPAPTLAEYRIRMNGRSERLRVALSGAGWSTGLLLPAGAAKALVGDGVQRAKVDAPLRDALRRRQAEWKEQGRDPEDPVFREPALLTFDRRRGPATLERLPASKRGFTAFLVATPGTQAGEASLTIVQENDGTVLGGNTFVLRPLRRPRAVRSPRSGRGARRR